ncbi:hypothetical protein [Streptomyces niveus]|uniref:hypothetical protein n=1 Tax=Streptomyces niveus TaxID=193462 RepID=UPI0003C59189|nr:hypothetical protein [Streptomyces niveus]EST22818.1 hypothetical protein M877_29005 [Streptomyces niveus NCIMB 11891]
MPDDTTRISAPIPVGIRPIPGGSRLVLDAFAQAVVEDVLDALLSTDRNDDLYERLGKLAEFTPEERAALPEHRLPYEELVADLCARSSKYTHLYGEKGLDLAERLGVNAVQALPVGHWSAEAWQSWQSVKADAEAVADGAAVNGGAAA